MKTEFEVKRYLESIKSNKKEMDVSYDLYGKTEDEEIESDNEKTEIRILEWVLRVDDCICINCKTTKHKSDCSVHNEPAERNEECTCL